MQCFLRRATVAGELTGGYAPPPKQNAAVIKWRWWKSTGHKVAQREQEVRGEEQRVQSLARNMRSLNQGEPVRIVGIKLYTTPPAAASTLLRHLMANYEMLNMVKCSERSSPSHSNYHEQKSCIARQQWNQFVCFDSPTESLNQRGAA